VTISKRNRKGPRMMKKCLDASRPFRSMFMAEKIGRAGEKGKGIWEDRPKLEDGRRLCSVKCVIF
jgi:hypothetical protein